MRIFYIIDMKTQKVIDMFFVDKVTGKKVDYSVEEFTKSIKQ